MNIVEQWGDFRVTRGSVRIIDDLEFCLRGAPRDDFGVLRQGWQLAWVAGKAVGLLFYFPTLEDTK